MVITRGSVEFREDQRGTPNSRSTSSRPGPDIVRNLLRRSSGLISSPIHPFEIMSVTCVEIVDRGIPKVLERLVTPLHRPVETLDGLTQGVQGTDESDYAVEPGNLR